MDPEVETTIPEVVLQEENARPVGMYQVWMLAISLAILQVGFGIVMPIFPFYIESLGMAGI